jgi:uncharacterized protein YacL
VNNKIWRLLFTVLLTGMAALLGAYAASLFLTWLLSDYDRRNMFSGAWVRPLYWGLFITGGLIFGVALGRTIFMRIESVGERLHQMSARDKLALFAGLTVGIALSALISVPIFFALSNSHPLAIALTMLIGIIVTYLTTSGTLSMKDEIRFYMPPAPEEEAVPKESFKVLDTNVIIDGRVADVARAGFLEGALYVPGFVLDELQHIADSADGQKRARGRRGLDILNQMRKELTLVVRTYDKLAPDREEVDTKLVRLAKALNAELVTNDFNLNKVAELQGVKVLNINELANALKPVVLPGEEMRVAVVKEGRESSQGVGYLDDGTMIVIEGGRRHVGETVEIIVSSLLQTTAGKMIFAHLREGEGGDDDYGRSVRAYSGGGPRRPIRGDRK